MSKSRTSLVNDDQDALPDALPVPTCNRGLELPARSNPLLLQPGRHRTTNSLHRSRYEFAVPMTGRTVRRIHLGADLEGQLCRHFPRPLKPTAVSRFGSLWAAQVTLRS
jgi:hypothetical protein